MGSSNVARAAANGINQEQRSEAKGCATGVLHTKTAVMLHYETSDREFLRLLASNSSTTLTCTVYFLDSSFRISPRFSKDLYLFFHAVRYNSNK